MPPKRFVRPGLNGTVTLRCFQSPQLETEAHIKKGELTEPLSAVAVRVGLRAGGSAETASAELCLADDQGLVLMGKLIDKGVYYITGGAPCDGTDGSSAARVSAQDTATRADSCGAVMQPPDTVVAWAFDPRVLRHRSETNRSPETPHRLQRAVEALQDSERARDILPAELLTPFTAHIDGSLEPDLSRAAPAASAANRSRWIPARLATHDEICSFQDADTYRDFLASGTALTNLRSDVYCCEESSSIAARLSAGAVIDATATVLRAVAAARQCGDSDARTEKDGLPLVSFCLVRPPGHHCTAAQPSGFCLVNNVAIATQQLRIQHASLLPSGLPRVAILDLDVHFGEGTASFVEDIADPTTLLYLSLHRYDEQHFYPFDDRGDTAYVGGGRRPESRRSICNVAVHTNAQAPAKCEQVISDHLLNSVMERVFLPRLAEFQPDVVLVSLGFDAAYGDPLGKMAVEGGFASSISRLKEWCLREGRTAGLVVVLEGGYNAEAVAQGVLSVALALTLPRTDLALQRLLHEKLPKVWADLRQRQERRGREARQLQRERTEEDAGEASPEPSVEMPLQVPEDTLLLERHKQWCAALVKKVMQLHHDSAAA
ncbi:histone deacetylase [Novymonas esmeraldas]|uniref:histone deacetylase n=1 Tax=Novymonas esmeraldas TaxID=1808958 RepID=A0AAW0F079_9TRYP